MRLSRALFSPWQVWQWATIGPRTSRNLRTSQDSAEMQPAAQICADLQAALPNAHLTNVFEDELFTIFSEILAQSFPQSVLPSWPGLKHLSALMCGDKEGGLGSRRESGSLPDEIVISRSSSMSIGITSSLTKVNLSTVARDLCNRQMSRQTS